MENSSQIEVQFADITRFKVSIFKNNTMTIRIPEKYKGTSIAEEWYDDCKNILESLSIGHKHTLRGTKIPETETNIVFTSTLKYGNKSHRIKVFIFTVDKEIQYIKGIDQKD